MTGTTIETRVSLQAAEVFTGLGERIADGRWERLGPLADGCGRVPRAGDRGPHVPLACPAT